MKKTFQFIGIIILMCFSFYYTDRMVQFSKNHDPLMEQIVSKQDDFNTYALESVSYDDYVLSGTKGKVVDVNESYKKMKSLGKYNENLLIFVDDLPSMVVSNNLDKFVVGVNTTKNDISLAFLVRDDSLISSVLDILNDNGVRANFFIDNKIEDDVVRDVVLGNHYIANLGDDEDYSGVIKSNARLKKYTNYDIKYCYSSDLNYEILNTCKKNKMSTVKAKYVYDNYLYENMKSNLSKGNVYVLEINNYIVNELDMTLKYVKQKGYSFKKFDEFFI